MKDRATPMAASAINTAWALSCRPEHRRFLAATTDVAASQRQLLAEILEANASTDVGRRYGFDRCSAQSTNLFDEYAFRVPPTTYDGIAVDIDRIAAGAPNVLTAEPVTILQPTSGSTGGRKLIPLTATVQKQFQRAISAWIADLFTARPGVRRGRAYWSISPAMAPEAPTAGGLPVGFADDTDYLGRLERLAVNRVLAVPGDAVRSATIDSFRRRTLAHLVLAPDLALVSVWSPTFLTTLVDELLADPDAVLAAAADLDPSGSAHAAHVLLGPHSDEQKLARLWPRLDTISCWADGSAAGFVPAVRRRFPGVTIQPKGLLATEAFVSFPLVGQRGSALALRSHVVEFEPLNPTDVPLLAHQLDVGGRYKPLVTTGGGLYRYRLGDVVEVMGHVGACPLLRFVGRAATSDLVGEKLDDAFVAHAVATVVAARSGQPDALLVPAATPSPARYVLILDGSSAEQYHRASRSELQRIGASLDAQLRANPHYAYARDVGQLAPVEAVLTKPGTTPQQLYQATMVERGVRIGDIKPVTLVTSAEVAGRLTAAVLGTPVAA